MKHKICLLVVIAVFGCSVVAKAQQAKKVYRIGFISAGSGKRSSEEAVVQALRELGYVEGQNLAIEWRFASGKIEPLPEFTAELVNLKVDAIIVNGTHAALVAKKATQNIPIIFAVGENPVESGVVASLARPGGNLTGVTDMAGELSGKRIELLKETVPKISRLAVLVWRPGSPGNAAEMKEIESAARVFKIQVQPMEI